MNDKIQRFGVVITPLSRKNISDNANYSDFDAKN